MHSIELLLAGLTEKKVYYFASPIIDSDEPHYWIVVKIDNDRIIHLACCTSQFEKRKAFVELRGLPYETLVYISKDDNVPFNKDTFVDCNSGIHRMTINDFSAKYSRGELTFVGEVQDSHFQQILTGIHASPMVEESFKSDLKREI